MLLTAKQNLLAALAPLAASPAPLPLPETKPGWRGVADARLRARPQSVRLRHARVLHDEVLRLADLLQPTWVGLYAPLGSEPDSRELANALLVRGIRLAYPRLRGDGLYMDLCAADGPSALQSRPRSRLMEPMGAPVDPAALQLVVVPCLGLHPQGYRLGRGGGYYDRWLPGLSPEAVTVGAVAADSILPFGPLEAHDARLDLAVTELGAFASHPVA